MHGFLPVPLSCRAAASAKRQSQSGDRQGAGQSPEVWLGLAPDTMKSDGWCKASAYYNSGWDPGEERESKGGKQNYIFNLWKEEFLAETPQEKAQACSDEGE